MRAKREELTTVYLWQNPLCVREFMNDDHTSRYVYVYNKVYTSVES